MISNNSCLICGEVLGKVKHPLTKTHEGPCRTKRHAQQSLAALHRHRERQRGWIEMKRRMGITSPIHND